VPITSSHVETEAVLMKDNDAMDDRTVAIASTNSNVVRLDLI